MKTVIILISVFLAVSFGTSAQTISNKEVQKTTYVCPMHSKEISDKKGNCPKCGMEMTPVKKEAEKTTYACPMHPKEMSVKEGMCSKCGMKMVKTTTLKHNSAVKGSQNSSMVKTMYVCPMHPKEMSDKMGKCVKCGMEMTKMEDKK